MRRAHDVLESGVAQRNLLLDLYLPESGESRPVLATVAGIRISGERPARLLLIVQDLTEEERLEAARRVSEERFRDLVQGLDAIVWEADAAALRFTFVSQRAETILGYPVERWLGGADFFAERIHPDDRARALDSYHTAVAKSEDHRDRLPRGHRRRPRGLAARHRPRCARRPGTARPAPRRHRRPDRAQARRRGAPPGREPAPPGPEDGRHRPARRRHRPRLQQPADGDPRGDGPHPEAARRRSARCARTPRASARPPTRRRRSPASSWPSAGSRSWRPPSST